MRHLLSIVLLIFITSCGNTKKTIETNNLTTTQFAEISISGMACQAGCADKIQANLLEVEGIKTAVVSFDNSSAQVSFDDSVVTQEVIEKTITDTKVKDYVYTINSITISNKN